MENKIEEHLKSYSWNKFKEIKKLKLEREIINIVSPKTKEEIKRELKEGTAVTVDPSEAYYLHFSRNNAAIYLLNYPRSIASFSTTEKDRTTITTDDKSYFRGKEIDMKSTDIIIDNYIAWVEQERRKEEEELLEAKRKEQEKIDKEKRKAEEKLKKEKALDDWFDM